MTFKDVCAMNHEIGIIQGVATAIENNAVADMLIASAEILEEIADELMKEVSGNETT